MSCHSSDCCPLVSCVCGSSCVLDLHLTVSWFSVFVLIWWAKPLCLHRQRAARSGSFMRTEQTLLDKVRLSRCWSGSSLRCCSSHPGLSFLASTGSCVQFFAASSRPQKEVLALGSSTAAAQGWMASQKDGWLAALQGDQWDSGLGVTFELWDEQNTEQRNREQRSAKKSVKRETNRTSKEKSSNVGGEKGVFDFKGWAAASSQITLNQISNYGGKGEQIKVDFLF